MAGAWLSHDAWLIGMLCTVILMLLALYLFSRRLKHLQLEQEMASGIMTQSYAFALNLVRHFMPSWRVQKYQFRGMRKKATSVDIAFKDLSLTLPSGAKILQSISGTFKGGRMCAIMGPSGAGKTTFMNVLAGKATHGKVGGEIRINGAEADIPDIKSVGFVPQDDIVHPDLTVREQIRFSALLRNDPSISSKRIDLITDDVLNVMQIDHIQNSIVGGVEVVAGISGGQRKRVNIGLELAAQPNVLFLDEPTSGLDSTSSLAVVLSLKKMCQLGMTSIMVIHQPRYSLFTLFDDVLLVGKGGLTSYLGPAADCKSYFEDLGFQMQVDENPADWFMDVISGEVPNAQIADFKPAMLPELWQERGSQRQLYQQSTSSLGRSVSAMDDFLVLEQKLQEEWDMIDRNKDGTMSEDELRQLLAHCSSMQPDPRVVRELFMRMAKPEAKTVSRKEFVDYLCSLKGDVADDQVLASLDQEGWGAPHRRWFRQMTRKRTGNSSIDLENGASTSTAEEEQQEEDTLRAQVTNSTETLYPSMNSKTIDSLAPLKRTIPGFFLQMHILSQRLLIQWWRKSQQRALFLVVLAAGAVVLACIDRWVTDTPIWNPGTYLNAHTSLALLVAIFCLQVFGGNRPLFWRERSRGLNVPAFYVTQVHMNILDLVLQVYIFTVLYFLIRQPGTPFRLYLVPFILVAYVASGWGYLISTIAPPAHGPFITSLVMFIVCGLLGNPTTLNMYLDKGGPEVVVGVFSITRWSVMMSFFLDVEETDPCPSLDLEKKILEYQKYVYDIGHWGKLSYWWTGFWAQVLMGTVLRVLGYVGLRVFNRRKTV